MEKENRTVRIAARAIYHLPVTPSMHVIDMPWETWREFLFASATRRKEIVLSLVGRDGLSHRIREVVWIPLDDQDQVVVREA